MAFADLPVVGDQLVDDPAWTYSSNNQIGGLAHLRVWAAEPGHLAVVTQSGIGNAVTNALEHIWVKLVRRYGEPLVLLEHWPADEADGDEHLDQACPHRDQHPWRRIWPMPDTNPLYPVASRWIAAYGHLILDPATVAHGTADTTERDT